MKHVVSAPPVIPVALRGIPNKCPPPLKVKLQKVIRKASVKYPIILIVPGVIPPAPVIYNCPPLPRVSKIF